MDRPENPSYWRPEPLVVTEKVRRQEPHLSEAEALWIVRRGLVEYELQKRKTNLST